jgi:hypothetical protein
MYAHGLRWHWAKRAHAGQLDGWSRETFATEWEAYLVAAVIARCEGKRLVASPEMRSRLIAHWRTAGQTKYTAGCPMDLCANTYERQGWWAAYQAAVAAAEVVAA